MAAWVVLLLPVVILTSSCFQLVMIMQVDNSQPWYVALAVLVCFSLFVQMAEAGPGGVVRTTVPQRAWTKAPG